MKYEIDVKKVEEAKEELLKPVDTAPEGFYTIPLLQIPVLLMEAINICNGVYGNGDERVNNILSLGYTHKDIATMQKLVNAIADLWGD